MQEVPDPILSGPFQPNQFWHDPTDDPGSFRRLIPYGHYYNDIDFVEAAYYLATVCIGIADEPSPTAVDHRLSEAVGAVQTAIWHWYQTKFGRPMELWDLALIPAMTEAVGRLVCSFAIMGHQERQWDWTELWALLCAVPTILPPGRARPLTALRNGAPSRLRTAAAATIPAWFGIAPTVTGRLWRARDGAGGRRALFIETTDPVTGEDAVYLVDVDLAVTNSLIGAGEHPTLEAAHTAWQTSLPDPAGATAPQPVTSPGHIAYLDYIHDPIPYLTPETVEPIMREYWRCQRRLSDAITWLAIEGLHLPPRRGLTAPADLGDDIAGFTAWLNSNGTIIAPVHVARFVKDWADDAVPGAVRCIAPDRIRSRCAGDFFWYRTEETLTLILDLLPHWVRYCAWRDRLTSTVTSAALEALPHTIAQLNLPDYRRL